MALDRRKEWLRACNKPWQEKKKGGPAPLRRKKGKRASEAKERNGWEGSPPLGLEGEGFKRRRQGRKEMELRLKIGLS